MEQFGVVVVAAGKGLRMGTTESKQFLLLDGKPIIVHTLSVFEHITEAACIILVVGEGDLLRCEQIKREYGLSKIHHIIAGGSERQASVLAGLRCLPEGIEWVLVHDGVRPFVTPKQVISCFQQAQQSDAAVLAVPVKDTIKIVDPTGRIESTPDRGRLWAIQTPQAFRLADLLAAHERALLDEVVGTDDAMLMERIGRNVVVVEGSYANLKITTSEDLAWAEYRLGMQRREAEDELQGGNKVD